jgi:hypothetical protein
MDNRMPSLTMEILAASALNSDVANLIQRSNVEVFQCFHTLLGGSSQEIKLRSEIWLEMAFRAIPS